MSSTLAPVAEAGSGGRVVAPRRHGSSKVVRRLLLLLVWAVCSSFVYWTAVSSSGPVTLGTTQSDYYNELTNGFLDGELSIPTPAPPGLVHLADPYNPYANAPWQAEFHDLSLYHGHLYLEWGPTPVLTLFMPWRLLHQGDMTQELAVLLYVVVGLGLVLMALDAVVGALSPEARHWKVVLSGLALGFGGVGMYLMRRPEVYEVAESSAYCFVGLGLYLTATGALGRLKRVRLAFAALAFGLAAGSRFNLLVLGAIPLVTFLAWCRRDQIVGWLARARLAAWVVGPFVLVALGLFAYNFVRFGSPLQIGSSYQLAGRDPTKTPFLELGYLAPSFYYDVFAPVRFTLAFPFLALPPPPYYPLSTPATFEPEILGGFLTTAPFVWLSAISIVRFRRIEPRVLVPVATLLATGVMVVVLLAIGVPGATERYETDFCTLFLFAAAIALVTTAPKARSRRFVLAAVATVLTVFTVLVGAAISVTGPDDELQTGNPATYDRIEQDFSFFPTWVTSIVGHPDLVRVINPLASYPYDLGDYGTYQPNVFFSLYLNPEETDVVAPSAGEYAITAKLVRATTAPRGSIHVNYVIGTTEVTFTLVDGRFTVDLPLKRGLNRIELSTTTFHPQAPGAFPEIVNVSDLSVRRAPSGSRTGVAVRPPKPKSGT